MPSTSATVLLALLLGGCGNESSTTPWSSSTDPTLARPEDTGPMDADGDGWTLARGDCADEDPSRHPGAAEVVADGIDQDCDGGDLCYADTDGDGYGSTVTVLSEDLRCTREGESKFSTDCADEDPSRHPGAAEAVADGIDQDCDGGDTCWADADGDGYGRSTARVSDDLDCTGIGESVVGTDCDDSDPGFSPDATEACNGRDDDCDGEVDERTPCEDCANGIDDDKDGLVDCEDGECAGMEPCAETICDDGLDGDDDGLVDCEDDDCWGPACHPAGVRARVLGGVFAETWNHHERRGWGSSYTPGWGCSGWSGRSESIGRVVRLRSIQGTVQVLPPGVPSWSATAARTTCPWSVLSVSFAYGYRSWWVSWGDASDWWDMGGYDATVSAPVRIGVHLDPGCRLAATSWFLPAVVAPCWGGGVATVVYSMPSHGCLWADLGPVWYTGSPVPGRSTDTSVRRTTPGTTYCAGADGWSAHDRRRTSMGVLDPGSVYTALP